MKQKTKQCCCCGSSTFPQLQDSNRDTGYGYCSDCLVNVWPERHELKLNRRAETVHLHTDLHSTIIVQKSADGEVVQVNML